MYTHINELVAEFCSFVCTAKTIQSKLGQSSLFVPTQRPIWDIKGLVSYWRQTSLCWKAFSTALPQTTCSSFPPWLLINPYLVAEGEVVRVHQCLLETPFVLSYLSIELIHVFFGDVLPFPVRLSVNFNYHAGILQSSTNQCKHRHFIPENWYKWPLFCTY